jgi:hypothetical protein
VERALAGAPRVTDGAAGALPAHAFGRAGRALVAAGALGALGAAHHAASLRPAMPGSPRVHSAQADAAEREPSLSMQTSRTGELARSDHHVDISPAKTLDNTKVEGEQVQLSQRELGRLQVRRKTAPRRSVVQVVRTPAVSANAAAPAGQQQLDTGTK